MKLVRFSFLSFVVASAVACTQTVGELDSPDQGEVTEDSFELGAASKVVGDTTCPVGYSLATPAEVRANLALVCNKLNFAEVARLSGGGSISGAPMGGVCTVQDTDTRSLGRTLCKKPLQFTEGIGDGVCPSGYTVANSMVARANVSNICPTLGTWDIARLSGGGSMKGSGYGCVISEADAQALGHTLCVQLDFVRLPGDNPCPAGSALISPEEARNRASALCSQLNTWDIARLDGGGSMKGPGYGCTIQDNDPQTLGHALCGAL